MKNDKGFTLIELLAVVLILITLAALITPKIFSQLKTVEKVTDKEQINSLINISKIYMNQHPNLLPEENNISVITINELKQSELIKSNEILNPSTKEELTGCIIVTPKNNKYEYEYKEKNCDKLVVVTFDANGGTVNQKSKVVTIDEPYGELPTPTREGYIFLGWNGKNIIDKSKSIQSGIQNETPFSAWADTAFNTNWIISNIKPSTTYTISYDIEGISLPDYDTMEYNNLGFHLYSTNSDKTTYPSAYLRKIRDDHYIQIGEKYHIEKNFTTTSNVNLANSNYRIILFTNRYLKNNNGVYPAIKLYHLQLEEGDTATPYEPYYITNDTTVTQSQNHTLKAIWKANS